MRVAGEMAVGNTMLVGRIALGVGVFPHSRFQAVTQDPLGQVGIRGWMPWYTCVMASIGLVDTYQRAAPSAPE